MSLTGRKAPAKPTKREKKKPKPIARKKVTAKRPAQPITRVKPMSKRKQDRTKKINAAILMAKGKAGWICQVTGEQFAKGDPELVGAHILEGRYNNSRPRWNPADWRNICPMKGADHAEFDKNKTPAARALWLREKANSLEFVCNVEEFQSYYRRLAYSLRHYARRIEWICDMTKPEEARP